MKKNDKFIPFANEIKKGKEDFKQMIDEMDDDAFLDMCCFLSTIDLEDEFDEEFDEDCDCEWCQSHRDGEYESPFSGEMINFKCTKCEKFSALPIEIVNDIYEETHKPKTECFHCGKKVSPVSYKAPDGKIFQN